jgi:hypothetical protein
MLRWKSVVEGGQEKERDGKVDQGQFPIPTGFRCRDGWRRADAGSFSFGENSLSYSMDGWWDFLGARAFLTFKVVVLLLYGGTSTDACGGEPGEPGEV